MSDDPVKRLVSELVQTIADSETEDDEDILNAVANLLVYLARHSGVHPETLITNIGKLLGAKRVDVAMLPIPKRGEES